MKSKTKKCQKEIRDTFSERIYQLSYGDNEDLTPRFKRCVAHWYYFLTLNIYYLSMIYV